jgi:hypothetical protein
MTYTKKDIRRLIALAQYDLLKQILERISKSTN